MTISELMEGKEPGSILIVAPGASPFRPYYRIRNHWRGLSEDGQDDCVRYVGNDDWDYVTTCKVTRYQWIDLEERTMTERFYTEEEVQDVWQSSTLVRAEWTATEFEETI